MSTILGNLRCCWTPVLWRIDGDDIRPEQNSESGATVVLVLTDHEANLPDVFSALCSATTDDNTFTSIHMIKMVTSEADLDIGNGICSGAVVNQTGYEMSPEIAVALASAWVLKVEAFQKRKVLEPKGELA